MDAHPVSSDVSVDLLERFGGQGPRYTSYPTADRFVEAALVGPCLRQHLRALAAGPSTVSVSPVSLYLHLPYCESPCFYCGCHKFISQDRTRGTRYGDYLLRELTLKAGLMVTRPIVAQVHLGGGTPNFLLDDDMTRLMQGLRETLPWQDGAECCVEVDPRFASPATLKHYGRLGFNRVSLGVQDFEPAVQRAINRIPSPEGTLELIDAARSCGFESVNVDLILGLPLQDEASFGRTLDRVLRARPDRIALYTYAHLPSRFRAQRQIGDADLPTPKLGWLLARLALARLGRGGYVHIGMDPFALPDDSLARAQEEGSLHRNFQGYTTAPEGDLIGLGVSATSETGTLYSQNAKTVPGYYGHLDRGELPVLRGVELTPDDLLRRELIRGLMCRFGVDCRSLEARHGIDFERYFRSELEELAPLQDAGLVHCDARAVEVTALGRFFVRRVAMVFDRHLRKARQRATPSSPQSGFSQVVGRA